MNCQHIEELKTNISIFEPSTWLCWAKIWFSYHYCHTFEAISLDILDKSFNFYIGLCTHRMGLPRWASPVSQLVKNSPAVWETWFWSLGWENPLEKRKAIHSSIPAWEFHGPYSPWGGKESDTTEWLSLSLPQPSTTAQPKEFACN